MEPVDIPFCVSPAGCSQMVVYPCLTVFACADILCTSLFSQPCVMYIHLPLLQAVLLYIILLHPLRTDNKTAMGFLDCFGGKVAKSCARKVIVMLGTTSELLWFYTML